MQSFRHLQNCGQSKHVKEGREEGTCVATSPVPALVPPKHNHNRPPELGARLDAPILVHPITALALVTWTDYVCDYITNLEYIYTDTCVCVHISQCWLSQMCPSVARGEPADARSLAMRTDCQAHSAAHVRRSSPCHTHRHTHTHTHTRTHTHTHAHTSGLAVSTDLWWAWAVTTTTENCIQIYHCTVTMQTMQYKT